MLAGSTLAGTMLPSAGAIAGMRADVLPAVGAAIGFRLKGAPAESARVAIYVDGRLDAVLPGVPDVQQQAGIPTLAEGSHGIAAYAVPVEFPIPRFRGLEYGRRALLRWEPSEDEDTRAYRIFMDSALAGESSGTEVHPREMADDGGGRLSIYGVWDGPVINEQFTIETGEGQWRHNLEGDPSPWQPILPGPPIPLPYGVQLRFHDPAGDYDGAYTVRVGPPTDWVTNELASGSRSVQVRPVDAAGNEGESITRSIAVVHLPDPPENARASWDGTHIQIGWDPAPWADKIEVYTNHSRFFGTLGDDLYEDQPWLADLDPDTGLEFEPPIHGLWLIRVRVRDAYGRLSDDLGILEVDTSGPPSDVALNEPEQLEAEATAGGNVSVSFAYRTDGGEDLAAFAIYAHPDPEDPSFDVPEEVIQAAAMSAVLRVVSEVGPFAHGTPVGFSVRARDGEGNETPNDVVVVAIPDAEAPSVSGPLRGGTA